MNSFDATRMYANARRSITCTRAHVHRQSGVTDITARDLVLEINTHLLYNITEVQNLVATSALATLVHFAATRFLLFGNVHASFLFISTHAVPVQLFKDTIYWPELGIALSVWYISFSVSNLAANRGSSPTSRQNHTRNK